MASVMKGNVCLTGTRGLLFDRYAGDNNTQLEPIDKVYWDRDGYLHLPQFNIYSCLAAENTKSVCRMRYGVKAKQFGMAIQNGFIIHDPILFIKRDGQKIHRDQFDEFFLIETHVARLKGGVPNVKVRPCLPTPWSVEFTMSFYPTADFTWSSFQQTLHWAGDIGLGTYRPLYGGFEVSIDVEPCELIEVEAEAD